MNLDYLRQQIIGGQLSFDTPFGEKLMTYADYTASGRSLKFIEDYMMRVEMSYANTHTEDGYAGLQTTKLYHTAKEMIKKMLNVDDQYVLISPGSGTTGAILKLTQILGIYNAPATREKNDTKKGIVKDKKVCEILEGDDRPIVFIGPYEHHSNDLIWREGEALVIEIPLDAMGKIDLTVLEDHLSSGRYSGRTLIGAFSAASNVTGMLSPVYEIARIIHRYGGLVFFDYAACGPYVKIDMMKDQEAYFDGIYLSPHKFLGGPGTSGLLVFHKKIYNNELAPTCAGGGTVEYVSSVNYDFIRDIEIREDAGTPPILQVIRTALAMSVKERIGYEKIEKIESDYIARGMKFLSENDKIFVIGPTDLKERLGICSFNIKYKDGYLHPRFVTKLLNDLFGIQGRAGCSCAGPYGHRLLGIDTLKSEAYRSIIKNGNEAMKPGWVRLNFHYTFQEETFEFIINAIKFIAEYGYLFLQLYKVDYSTGLWEHVDGSSEKTLELNVDTAMKLGPVAVYFDMDEQLEFYKRALEQGEELRKSLEANKVVYELNGEDEYPDLAWFYEVN